MLVLWVLTPCRSFRIYSSAGVSVNNNNYYCCYKISKPINTKAKVVSVHDLQPQRGRRDKVPFIQSLGTRWMSG